MSYAQLDAIMLEYRRQRDFEGAAVYLAMLAPESTEHRGVILAHQGLNLYRQSPDNTIEALQLCDDALPLLSMDVVRSVRCAMDALIMARYLGQLVRAKRYVGDLLMNSCQLETIAWLGRIYYNVALYYLDVNNLTEAEIWLCKARDFYRDHIGPHNEHDGNCQKGLTKQAMCHLYVRMGKDELAREAFADAILLQEKTGAIPAASMEALHGWMAIACGRAEAAVGHYWTALRYCVDNHDHVLTLLVIDGLGMAHRMLERPCVLNGRVSLEELTGRPFLRLQRLILHGG